MPRVLQEVLDAQQPYPRSHETQFCKNMLFGELPDEVSVGDWHYYTAMPQQPDALAPTAAQRPVRAVRGGVLE